MEKELGSQGHMYQIFNRQSLGVSEDEILKNVKIITDKIIEQERLARKILTKRPIDLEDRICRAYGVLVNCKKITPEECRDMISEVKLGVDLGIIEKDKLDDIKINKLLIYTRPRKFAKILWGRNKWIIKRCKTC